MFPFFYFQTSRIKQCEERFYILAFSLILKNTFLIKFNQIHIHPYIFHIFNE